MRVMPKLYNFSNQYVNNFKFLTCDNQGYKLVFMNMADRIKQRMLELDIKQEELGKAAGLTQPAIFKLLSGKTQRTTRLAEIAKALKVRPEWLATGEGPMTEQGPPPTARDVIHEIEQRTLTHELGESELALILDLVKRISSPRNKE